MVTVSPFLIALIVVTLTSCTSSLSVPVHPFLTGLDAMKGRWPPLDSRPRLTNEDKLRIIRQISPSQLGKPDPREDVCYTTECLDASLALLKSINFSVNPCDDFYQYACGRWIAENPVPEEWPTWNSFMVLIELVNNITQGILTTPKDEEDFKPINQSKDLYETCIDLGALQQAALTPILDNIQFAKGWPSVTPNWDETQFDLVEAIADSRRSFLQSIVVQSFISPDLKNTMRSVIYLDQPSFFLSRQVLLDQVSYVASIDATVNFYRDVAKQFALAANVVVDDAALEADAREMIAFETELAKISSPDEARTNTSRIYNPRKLDEFDAGNAFDWTRYFELLFSNSEVTLNEDENLVVRELDFMSKFMTIVDATPKQTLSNYVHWRLISGLVSDTTQEMRDIKFEFDKVTQGLTEQQPRESVCVATTLNTFGMAIGVKYVEQAFDVTAKDNVDQMVNNLRTTFKDLLAVADWLSDETKEFESQFIPTRNVNTNYLFVRVNTLLRLVEDPVETANAATKADKMRQFMAFPDWLYNQTRMEMEYAGAELIDGKYFESTLALNRWINFLSLKTLRIETDKDVWIAYPGVVNAYNNFIVNSITFPAGILQPPFYRINGPESLNYGGIGVVIGHEITHGFDDQGSQYDSDGNAMNWWTEEDSENFLEKAQCIVDQYGSYTVPGPDGEPLHLNGDLTSGENIGDNGGVRQAYLAYQTWIENNNGGVPEKRLPGLEDITPNQLFFLGHGNVWCDNSTPEYLIMQVNIDPHSPSQYRVNGPLVNSVAFSEQWGCPADSPMNSPNKCIVW